ncbi:MAG: hypothetical protein N2C14_29880, partial [Planctomycetales bacterium]
ATDTASMRDFEAEIKVFNRASSAARAAASATAVAAEAAWAAENAAHATRDPTAERRWQLIRLGEYHLWGQSVGLRDQD